MLEPSRYEIVVIIFHLLGDFMRDFELVSVLAVAGKNYFVATEFQSRFYKNFSKL
jgi:hypothetical protein